MVMNKYLEDLLVTFKADCSLRMGFINIKNLILLLSQVVCPALIRPF